MGDDDLKDWDRRLREHVQATPIEDVLQHAVDMAARERQAIEQAKREEDERYAALIAAVLGTEQAGDGHA